MIFGIIGAILLLLGLAIFGLFGGVNDDDAVAVGGFITFIGALVLIFGSALPTIVAYNGDVNDTTAVTQLQRNEVIYKQKAKDLTGQLSAYLAVQYPNLERQILDKIASNPQTLFVVYPQLQSSRTLVTLTSTIERLQTSVYDQELAISQKEKNISVRKKNLFFWTWVLPHAPNVNPS